MRMMCLTCGLNDFENMSILNCVSNGQNYL